MKHVNVYICSSLKGFSKQKHGAYGFVLEYKTDKGPVTFTKFSSVEHITRNLSLLIALNEALERIHDNCNLTIYTDSNYIKQGLDSWILKWQQNGFVNQRGEEIANRTDWELASDQISCHVYTVLTDKHEYTSWMEREVIAAEKRGINKYGNKELQFY